MRHTSFVATRLLLKCLSLCVTVCSSCSSYQIGYFSLSCVFIHRHIWMEFLGLGSVLPFLLLAVAFSSLLFFASFVPLLFIFEMFLFLWMGCMRDKPLRFVRRTLLYLLNATALTLLNTPLARTGHAELQATAHVNTDTYALKLVRKRAPEKWPRQGQNAAVLGIGDERGIVG